MRITFNLLTERIKYSLADGADRLYTAQDKVTTGKRINRPSDDVPGIGRCLTYRSAISSIEQFERNSNIATSQLATTSSTLDSVVSQLQKVREKALEAGKVTSVEEREAIVDELDSISKQLAGTANTQHLGKYIFAGNLSDTEPMIENPGGDPPYTFVGDANQFTVQVGPGVYIPTTVTGDKVFNIGSVAISDAPDVFTTIKQLKDLILAGDVTGISDHLTAITDNLDNVTAIRSQVGARLRQTESNQDSLADSKLRVQDLLSKTEDADYAEAIIDLKNRENIYQAAIAMAGRIIQTSLADYLN